MSENERGENEWFDGEEIRPGDNGQDGVPIRRLEASGTSGDSSFDLGGKFDVQWAKDFEKRLSAEYAGKSSQEIAVRALTRQMALLESWEERFRQGMGGQMSADDVRAVASLSQQAGIAAKRLSDIHESATLTQVAAMRILDDLLMHLRSFVNQYVIDGKKKEGWSWLRARVAGLRQPLSGS